MGCEEYAVEGQVQPQFPILSLQEGGDTDGAGQQAEQLGQGIEQHGVNSVMG
ncbi:hypothetical protein D3C79_985650 [compost metagenome]